MARIVLISPYLKGGQNAAKLAQRTRYVATRPGVELLADERSTLPATKKQRDFIRSRSLTCAIRRARTVSIL